MNCCKSTGLLIITPKPGFRACTYIKPVNAKKNNNLHFANVLYWMK